MSDDATITVVDRPSRPAPSSRRFALVIVWSAAEPHRIGELAFVLPHGACVLGRGDRAEGESRLVFGRQRPGAFEARGPLAGKGLSRRQLHLRARRDGVGVERVGRCPMLVGGREVDEAQLREGDVVVLAEQLVLLCTKREAELPETRSLPPDRWPAFGRADEAGIIGESPMMWRLRDRLALVAASAGHVLVLGPSGVGKELVAGAVHRSSRRADGPFVARNAATLPESLVDAELFGHVADYPQAGMPPRAGLVGDAEGGTLFLDEIGELPAPLQAHLLRLLDGGEYQRLGDTSSRRADLRMVAATNRGVDELKGDFAARLKLRLQVPGLEERREDVPLLLVHLLQRALEESPTLRDRFDFVGEGPTLLTALEPAFVAQLVAHAFDFHVRELDRLLWEALVHSPGPRISAPPASASSAAAPIQDVTPEAIRQALARHHDNKTAAAADLGISRYQLYRLLKQLPPE